MADDISPDKTKLIEEKLTEIVDLQNLLQLDMLNLKNEIEKIKLFSPSPLNPEKQARLAELERISGNVEVFKSWEKIFGEVKSLKQRVESLDPKGLADIAGLLEKAAKGGNALPMDKIKSLAVQVDEIRTLMEKKAFQMPSGFPDTYEKTAKEVQALRSELEAMKGNMPKGGPSKMQAPPMPSSIQNAIKEMDSRLTSLAKEQEGFMASLKEIKSAKTTTPAKIVIEKPDKIASNVVDILNDMQAKNRQLSAKIDGFEARIQELSHTTEKAGTGPDREILKDVGFRVDKLMSEYEKASNEIAQMRNELEKAKASAGSAMDGSIRKEIMSEIEANRKSIAGIYTKMDEKKTSPAEGYKEMLTDINGRVKDLEKFRDTVSLDSEEEIESLRKLLLKKMEEIDKNSSILNAADVKKMVKSNRSDIDNLKKIMYREVDKKIQGVEDFIVKERVRDVEKRIDILNARFSKLDSIKPISVPSATLPMPPMPNRYSPKEFESMKKTMKELEKALENKKLGPEIIKEMAQLKESMAENKKEMESMMKGSGKGIPMPARSPELISVTRRLDEIEAKVNMLHITSPLIIE